MASYDVLEREVAALSAMPYAAQPVGSVSKVCELVKSLTEEASRAAQGGGEVTSALVTLERAQSWAAAFITASEKSPLSSEQRNSLAELLRLYATSLTQSQQLCADNSAWDTAIVYSRKTVSALAQLTHQLLEDGQDDASFESTILLERTRVALSGLLAKVQAHEDSLEAAETAVKNVDVVLLAISTKPRTPQTEQLARKAEALLPYALFNTAMEYEHLKQQDAARKALQRALPFGNKHLGEQHYLVLKIRQVLADYAKPKPLQRRSTQLPSAPFSHSERKSVPTLPAVKGARSKTSGGSGWAETARVSVTAGASRPRGSAPCAALVGPVPSGALPPLLPVMMLMSPMKTGEDNAGSAACRSHSSPSKLKQEEKQLAATEGVIDLRQRLRQQAEESATYAVPHPPVASAPSTARRPPLVSVELPPPGEAPRATMCTTPPAEIRTAMVAGGSKPTMTTQSDSESVSGHSSRIPSRRALRDRKTPSPVSKSPRQSPFAIWELATADALYGSYTKRTRAAIKVQCAWRSAKARLAAFNRRQVLYHYAYQRQRAAAQCVTSFLATLTSRKRAKKRVADEAEQARVRAADERRRMWAVRIIMRQLRWYMSGKKRRADLMRKLKIEQEAKLVQYESAAITLQRWWPIAKRERKIWQEKNERLREERKKEAEAMLRHRAATQISRVWRGVLGRRYALERRKAKAEEQKRLRRAIRESIDVIRVYLGEYAAKKKREKLQEQIAEDQMCRAVQRISDEWQECLRQRASHEVVLRARAMTDAAAAIQRCYRAHRARRELRVRRVIRNSFREKRVVDEWKRERAARKIQCAFRCHMARITVKKMRCSSNHKMVLSGRTIKRVVRGYWARAVLRQDFLLRDELVRCALNAAVEQRERLVVCIQSYMRAKSSTVTAISAMKAMEAEELLVFRRMKRERKLDAAAIIIQKWVRRFLAALHYLSMKKEVEAEVQRIYSAVVTLQCFFRRTGARRELQRRKAAWRVVQAQRREYEEVQAELFLMRVAEVCMLEEHERARIEKQAEAGGDDGNGGPHDDGPDGSADDHSHIAMEGRDDEDAEEGIYDAC